MPETDVTKMKVADLKRELKLRGLPVHGNKNELQDRLQTALLEGDISLEDSAIADNIDDDVSLTDEDEHKLLGDEHDDLLLKTPVVSPTSTPTVETSPLLATIPSSINVGGGPQISPNSTLATTRPLPAKKVVLKRNNSQLLSDHHTLESATVAATAKENEVPAPVAKEPEGEKKKHKPIVVGSSSNSTNEKKASELTMQERMEMRAKKFGITATDTVKKEVTEISKSSKASIVANKGNKETEEQQKEALKRRAERFGNVVPEKSPKTAEQERLQKRKERFGEVTTSTTNTSSALPNEYAEKARARLERFKIQATPSK